MSIIDDVMEAGHVERRGKAAARAARDEREKQQRAAKSLFGTGKDARSGKRFDWASESAESILALIDLVTSRGGAIRFGYSRDGYAGSIGVYLGDSRDTLWINPDEGSDLVIEKISRLFAEMADRQGVSPQS